MVYLIYFSQNNAKIRKWSDYATLIVNAYVEADIDIGNRVGYVKPPHTECCTEE